ncbi:hypothetical protein D9M71_335150 [compost metagenome]
MSDSRRTAASPTELPSKGCGRLKVLFVEVRPEDGSLPPFHRHRGWGWIPAVAVLNANMIEHLTKPTIQSAANLDQKVDLASGVRCIHGLPISPGATE